MVVTLTDRSVIPRAVAWWMIESVAATLASGILLSFAYTPKTAYIYDPPSLWSDRIRLAHNFSVVSLVASCIASLIVVVVRRRSVVRAQVVAAACVATITAPLFAFVSGSRLAWQGVALKVLQPGRDVKGVWSAAFDRNVWVVAVGGRDVTNRYAAYLLAHLLLAVGIACCVALVSAFAKEGP